MIMKEVRIQYKHIMYEKENDQLGKNSWPIKRCGKKCIQSIKKWTTSNIIGFIIETMFLKFGYII
jgi:hypothetical protein